MEVATRVCGEPASSAATRLEAATSPTHTANWDYVKENVRDQLGKLLFTKTKRRPMVLPVIIEV